MIHLTGEQERILALPPKNPIQIKGVAGSGKTTIAIKRAKALLDGYEDMFRLGEVVIFSFGRPLSGYIKNICKDEGFPLSEEIEPGHLYVTTFHKWAYAFLASKGVELNVVDNREYYLRTALKKFADTDSHLFRKPIEFFLAEIHWIKGKLISDKQTYLDTPRIGRGKTDRVVGKDKEFIWQVYESFREEFKKRGQIEFDDFAQLVLDNIDKDFEPPFTHIVIDEAQDLTKAQLIVLSKLVKDDTKSLTIIADAAQKIYQSGFSWSEVGINIRGARTCELKKNYRSAGYIARAASSLLVNDEDSSEFTQVEIGNEDGKKPIVKRFDDDEKRNIFITNLLKDYFENHPDDVACVLSLTKNKNDVVAQDLNKAGIRLEVINKSNSLPKIERGTTIVATLYSVKGMEFDLVILADFSFGQIPSTWGIEGDDDDLHISRERRLLYTVMTRAKRELYMLYKNKPSVFLKEIDPECIEIQS